MKTNIEFNDEALDEFLCRWLNNEISEQELKEWKTILSFNTKLREEFCDFVKGLRDEF